MGFMELFLLAFGLAMDAFAVSVCKGLALKRVTVKNAMICGAWFGGFQALMPFLGYLAGSGFERFVDAVAPWIAFALLALIGGNMIREALLEDEEQADAGLDWKTMFWMAIATSIDALAIGITFACVPLRLVAANGWTNLLIGVGVIGVITCVLSCIGVKIGNVFGTQYRARAELFGGVILIGIGLKVLVEHFINIRFS
ncbi:MAG: manganese efflux pump [Clostridia bacterium]|nr:manganese efflux pump [Clostridia bacterium]